MDLHIQIYVCIHHMHDSHKLSIYINGKSGAPISLTKLLLWKVIEGSSNLAKYDVHSLCSIEYVHQFYM